LINIPKLVVVDDNEEEITAADIFGLMKNE